MTKIKYFPVGGGAHLTDSKDKKQPSKLGQLLNEIVNEQETSSVSKLFDHISIGTSGSTTGKNLGDILATLSDPSQWVLAHGTHDGVNYHSRTCDTGLGVTKSIVTYEGGVPERYKSFISGDPNSTTYTKVYLFNRNEGYTSVKIFKLDYFCVYLPYGINRKYSSTNRGSSRAHSTV